MYTKQDSAIILIGVVGSRTTTDSTRAVGKEKAKFHSDRTRTEPRGLFRETRAADSGLRQSPRTL